jgi:hypothetical protein
MKGRYLVFSFIVLLLFSCSSSKLYLSDNAITLLASHERIGVLPMKVSFSEDYKRMRGVSGPPVNWPEQERLAGLDLQKDVFMVLTQRAAKKNYSFTVLDFLQMNKVLEKEDIRFSELLAYDKVKIARLLGVDAVIWGQATMDYSPRSMASRNGMSCQMQIFDSKTGELVWQDEVFQEVRTSSDTPNYLASRGMSQLVGMLPYKKGKVEY